MSEPNRASPSRPKFVCQHLVDVVEADLADYVKRYTGVGLEYFVVCSACRDAVDERDPRLRVVSDERFARIERDAHWEQTAGSPEPLVGETRVAFEHEEFASPDLARETILDARPVAGSPDVWLAATSAGRLLRIDAASRRVEPGPRWPEGVVDLAEPTTLRVSSNGELAAVCNTQGRRGVVLETATGKETLRLDRGDYHYEQSTFPVAFVERKGRSLVVHGTDWNRLDVSDARTGELLTPRDPTSYDRGEPRPPHYLDYFHGALAVSPDQKLIADSGWAWHPLGVVTTWSLDRWLDENVWESEDGPSKLHWLPRGYLWDAPMCWLDDRRLAVWGHGPDDLAMLPAATLLDATAGFDSNWGEPRHWFPGPEGRFAVDRFLFAFNERGTTAWDVATGERVGADASLVPHDFHPASRRFIAFRPDGVVRLSRAVSTTSRPPSDD